MPHKDPQKRRDYLRKYRLTHPRPTAEQQRQYNATYRAKAGPRAKQSKHFRLKRRYGITLERFNDLIKEQNGRCALCGNSLNDAGKRTHVDHCHETKIIRGVVCSKCNVGLGQFDDSVDQLRGAIAYLEQTNPEPTWRNFAGQ